jgi:hypothetical protein
MSNNENSILLREAIKVDADKGVAAALEAQRLAEKYGRDFFDCEDLIKILGVGRGNVRALMCSEDFPTICIGNRKVVSALALALWATQPKD